MNLDRRVEQYTRNTRDKLQGAHRPRSAKVFVEDNELNSYIKETGIQLVRLPNGITVIALARGTQDSIITSIETSTPNGAYCDPPDQPGLTHFAEHLLIPQQLSQHAGPLGVSLNASTSWRTLSQVAYGPLNPAYPEYGLLPILPKLRDALADPFSMVLDQQRVVDGERRAILAEMTRDNSQHDEIVDSWPLEILLAQDNPLAINPLGSEDAVKKVTVEDLRRHLRRIVNPDGMTITVFAEGKPLGKRVAVRELEKLFKDFPPSDGVAKPFPWDKLDQLNPDLCTETVYQKDTGIRTGQVSALLFWPIRRELYGRSYFALRNFSTLLSRDLHTVARHVGLGYVEGVKIIETSGELAILATRVDFRKQDFDSEEFAATFPDLIKSIIIGDQTIGAQGITDERMRQHLEQVIRREKATPTSMKHILQWADYGLRYWGKLIDARKIDQMTREVTLEDMQSWREQIISQIPVAMLIGDLPEISEKN